MCIMYILYIIQVLHKLRRVRKSPDDRCLAVLLKNTYVSNTVCRFSDILPYHRARDYFSIQRKFRYSTGCGYKDLDYKISLQINLRFTDLSIFSWLYFILFCTLCSVYSPFQWYTVPKNTSAWNFWDALPRVIFCRLRTFLLLVE